MDHTTKKSQHSSYTTLGLVFGILGLVWFLTADQRGLGLPFLVIGIVFYSYGRDAAKKAERTGT